MRRRRAMDACALVLALAGAAAASGCAQLKTVGDDALMQTRGTIARMGTAVDQAEGMTSAYLRVAEGAVRDLDKAETEEDRAAVLARANAQMQVLDRARQYRVEHGPELLLEKLVEALDRIVAKIRD